MNGNLCRFCNHEAEKEMGFALGRHIVSVPVCFKCSSSLSEQVVCGCKKCGNLWLRPKVHNNEITRVYWHCVVCQTNY